MDKNVVSMMIWGAWRKDAGTTGAGENADRARREVRAYWEGLRHDGALPQRDALDPRGIAGALEQVFMIERIAPGLARFRLVGSQITDLVGCEVRGMPVTALFDPVARDRLGDLLDTLFDTPAILHLDLEAERGIGRPALAATLSMMPLMSQNGRVDLALGCLSLDGIVGRAPRRFAIAKSRVETLLMPAARVAAPAPEPAAALPRPPRTERHLRLVHSAP